jgi:hypothetical protein
VGGRARRERGRANHEAGRLGRWFIADGLESGSYTLVTVHIGYDTSQVLQMARRPAHVGSATTACVYRRRLRRGGDGRVAYPNPAAAVH